LLLENQLKQSSIVGFEQMVEVSPIQVFSVCTHQ